jgi:hypothetical protein
MRIVFSLAVTASLCLVAGCNRGGSANNSVNAPAPATNAPVESAAPPAQTPAPSAGGTRNPSEVQECVQDVQSELPAGTDVNAFCNCAVDGMAANGGRERPAMEQCAAQMGIQPRG